MVTDQEAWLSTGGPDGEPFLSSLMTLASFRIVDLESPLGVGPGRPKSGPRLVSDPGWAEVLVRTGVDAVCLANNHAMDQGSVGLEATLTACDAAGLRCVGAGMNLEQACRPLDVQLGNRCVDVIAAAEHEFGAAGRDSAGTCPLGVEHLIRQIRTSRMLDHDVIALLHGGNEHFPFPRPGLRETCRALVDCGAAAVVCVHSHVVGSLEWYAGCPILYGLGNLYFPTPGLSPPEGFAQGLCVILGFDPAGRVDVTLVPTRFEGSSGVGPVTEADAGELAARLEARSRVVADDEALEREWRRWVAERRRSYLSGLLGLTKLERIGMRAGIWPWWRVPRSRTPHLLNLIRCESHREALLYLLEDEVDRLWRR
jgi:hypothetical protein